MTHVSSLPGMPFSAAPTTTLPFCRIRHALQDTAGRWPDAIALEGLGVRWTYRQLSAQVAQRQAAWRDAGMQAGQRIGIAATRSADTIVSILAAVEAGLAYVPLDLSYPPDRLQAMLRDAQVRAVVGEAEALQRLHSLVPALPTLAAPAPAGAPLHADTGDLTYVLFTSGSTGQPKGVAMGETPLSHLIGWHVAHPRLGQAARTLQFAPLSFDVHFQEILSTVATGGTLVLISDEERRDPARLRQSLVDMAVSRLYLPYVALQMLAQADAEACREAAVHEGRPSAPLPLQDIVSAGEQLQITPDIRALFARLGGAVLHNHYGPTESHVVTAHELEGNPDAWPQIPPIGRALPHVRVCLRPTRDDEASDDTEAHAAPQAADLEASQGELLLGGDCLAAGYLGRADLSAERFLEHVEGQPGRWYVTGDLVRADASQTLTYLGRADQQLKVDGFRIEPGDIELALMAHPSLQDAVVTAPTDPDGSRILTAHVVLRADAHAQASAPPVAEWRNWLRSRVPDYMVPVRFAVLDRLPTTPSGKIDRRGLPAVAWGRPAGVNHPGALEAKGPSDIAALIRGTWQELLGLPTLEDNAQLFDLGARSLLVMRFVARMKDAGIRLSVADVYDRPSVAGLTALATRSTAPATSGRPERTAPATPHVSGEGMAIVGMALRVGDARDLDTFWQHLLDGQETVRRFSPDEIDASVPAELRRQPNFVAARGVLADADCFDAAFFGISAREARLMDPQQRLFLELCWTGLEHAGIDPTRSSDRVGVYAGVANNAYLPAMRAEDPGLISQAGEFTAMLANEKDYVATRVAHRLNFNGPAVAIHTACSTSLVAVTQAWHALAQGQCDVALAGGVTVIVPQTGGYLHVEGGMESADGRCRPFDAQASGTVFGSGGGVVVLKRLSQALADGDTVYGVIKGVGLNNDGGDKASFTAPSVSGQAQAIRMALSHADVGARSIGYVEAHGTGTALGDPIEVAALTRAWAEDTSDTGFCRLGSVKGHIGHLVAAAGVLGLIKATLALHRECVPGTLHYQQPNPQIDFASTPFQVHAQAQAWPRAHAGEAPRRAAVSSFGVGGTNAHVILEEGPAPAARQAQGGSEAGTLQLLPLSAKHPDALRQRAHDLAQHLKRLQQADPDLSLGAVAATLVRGRQAMPMRAAVVAATVSEAMEALGKVQGGASSLRAPRLVFLFPGQGSQHPGMARGLCDALPAFREAFSQCLDAAPDALADTLRRLLTQADPGDEEAAALLAETRHAQPALFAVSHALGAWLDSLGLRPQAMIGHSIGEYAAACHAGVMDVADAMRAVIARGEAMFAQAPGAMLAVRSSADTLRPLLPATVDIAALNAPQLTVVAGPHADIAQLASRLEASDIGVTRLKVSHAFHSAAMDGALPLVREALGRADLRAPQATLYSCVTGEPLRAEEATDPGYWARQVRAPVAFSRAVQAEQALGQTVFIEVGPSQALSALVRQHRDGNAPPSPTVPLLSSAQTAMQAGSDPARHALHALGQAWALGADVAWPVPAQSRRLALPTYPFRREVHWFTRSASATAISLPSTSSPLPPAMNRLPRIEQEIVRILNDVAGLSPDTAQRDATFVDQGLDSLSLTQATLEFEKTFGIKLRFRRLLEDLDTQAKLAAFFDAQLPADKFAPEVPPPVVAAQASAVQQAVPVQVSTPLPVPMPSPAGNALQQVIQQQMQLMSQQLALLAGQPLPAATTPLAAPQVAPPTVPAAEPSPPAPAMAEQPGKNALVEKPFGASARIVLKAQDDITPVQQRWIDDFIQRYNARTGRSKAFSQAHRKVMSDPRVVTGFNPLWKDLVYPIVADRSEGARIWDIDGNEYIDLLSCFGANLLGYKPADVTQAMVEQLARGIEVGPQHPMAAEVAQLISDMTGMERVAFCNTGSEAVMGAMRMARTVTGRKKIAIFNNSYHGIFDEVIVRGTKQLRSLSAAPGILANAVENILVLDYDSQESLETLRKCAHELAAIMIEPIQNKYPTLQPTAFVRQLREIATQGGAALIFDEVVTGFRVAPGGAQEFYGVRADIATYGKIIGGGLPFAAIAGGSLWMDALDGGHWQYGDDSYPEAGVTYFAGTFVRHPLALAAARATLQHLQRGGHALYDKINARTQRLADKLNAAFAARNAPVKAVHCASLWRLSWDDNTRNISLFYYLARFQGLHLYEQFGHFVTEAMQDADTDLIADTFIRVLDELMGLGLIDPRNGPAPGGPGGGKPTLPEDAPAPLTPGQTERWLAASFDTHARKALNESFCLSLTGPVDQQALRAALQDVWARHEAFRTCFDAEAPLQRLTPSTACDIQTVDLRAHPDAPAALDTFCAQASLTDLALQTSPLARVSLVQLADGRTVVHLVVSHLIFDGWASGVFLADLATAYRARSQGVAPAWTLAAESPRQFGITEQARWESPQGQEDLDFWRQTLAQAPVALSLGDREPPRPRHFTGDTLKARYEGPLLAALKAKSKQLKATLFQLTLASVAQLIHRRTGREDFIVSVPCASQSLAQHGPLIGDGVLDLPLRLQCSASTRLEDLVAQVKTRLLDALEHPLTTQGSIARALGLQSSGDRPPLTGVYFNFNPKLDLSGFAPLKAEMVEARKLGLLSEVIFNFYDNEDALTLDLHHSTEFFSPQQAQGLIDAFGQTLRDVADTGEQPPIDAPARVHGLPLADWQTLERFNATTTAFPRGLRLGDLIRRTVAECPDAQAVRFEGRSISYRELDQRAWALAERLRGLGVAPGTLVGVSLERSIELVVALVGVVYSGGAYVPLDPAYPLERLSHMCEDAAMQIVVTEPAEWDKTRSAFPAGVQTVFMGTCTTASPHFRQELVGTPADPAYVIFTSGSTGRPKGAMNAHEGIVNRLQWMQQQYQLGPADKVLQKTPYSFDVSVWEFFWPLMTGATVVEAKPEGHRDANYLKRLIASEGVTFLHFVPSMLRLFLEEPGLDELRAIRQVVCSGEALPLDAVERFFELLPHARLDNLYGPTEAAVDVTWWPCKPHDPLGLVPIGHPIANTRMYVLDEQLRPLPPGAEGELYIGGVQVGMGYVARPDLTAERFLPDPFHPGERMYKTGDVGRWLPNGAIEYMGRADLQIKLRGNRIELGEIEAQLMAMPTVLRCVVAAKDFGAGDVRLVAYIVGKGAVPSHAEVKQHLSAHLPEYMLPQHVMGLADIPLLPNGKIDRKALPLPSSDATAPTSGGTAPRTAIEQGVASAMQAVLKTGALSLEDDFFALGGHSLLAARLIAQLNREFDVQLQLRALFESPTVAKLAAAVVAQHGEGATPARPPLLRRTDRSTSPMSVMQQRVAFMESLQPGRLVYHAPSGHRLRGPMNLVAFNQAYREMARRQEAFRTSIVKRGGELVQVMDTEQVLPDLPLQDLSHLPESEREAAMQAHMNALVSQTFALDRAPLIRSQLYKLAEDHHGFFLMAHHIVWDGASFDVLYREMSAHYAAFAAGDAHSPLPELTVDHGDFTVWHNAWMKGEEIRQQLRFWEQLAATHPTQAVPPIDRVRPEQSSGNGATAFIDFDHTQAEAVRAVARQTGSPVSVVFLAMYAALMSEWMQDAAPGIGLPVRGRPAPELEHVMGFFNNMLPMRVAVRHDLSAIDWVREVRRQITGALSNQDVPFELIAQQLKLKSGKLYQVLFNFQDVRDRITRWGDLEHERINLLKYGSTEDMNFWLVEEKEKIGGGFQYDTDVILPATAEALRDRYAVLMQRLIERPNSPLRDLLAPTDAEAQRLQDWQPTPSPAHAHALQLVLQPPQGSEGSAIALRSGNRTLTANELAKRVEHCADTLMAHLGAVPARGDAAAAGTACIGVDIADPLAQLVASLAVWRLGMACVAPSSAAPDVAHASGMLAFVTDRALALSPASGCLQLGAHLVPGFQPDMAHQRPAAVAAPIHSAQASLRAVTAQQLADVATGLAQRLGEALDGTVLIADTHDAHLVTALTLAARLRGAVVQFPEGADDTRARQALLATEARVALIAPTQAALLASQTKRQVHTVLLPVTGTHAPLLAQLLAAHVRVFSVLTSPASGVPVAAGWIADARDAGCCGQALQHGLHIVGAQGETLGVNALGHLSDDQHRRLPLRWRADGQLHCPQLPELPPPGAAPELASASHLGAPASDRSTEAVLIGIWQGLLGIQDIGAKDNFFELGGNSLLAMVAIEEARKALGIDIDARRFVFETLGQLASVPASGAAQCPPQRPEIASLSADPAATSASPAATRARRGWLDRARDALSPRSGSNDGAR